MRQVLLLSPEQALTVLREVPASPGLHPPERVLDAAEVVLSLWGVLLVPLKTGQWVWRWQQNAWQSEVFEARQDAINDAVERQMKPPPDQKGVV